MSSLFLLAHIHQEFEDLAHVFGVNFECLGSFGDAVENDLFALGVLYLHAAFLFDLRDALYDVCASGDAFDYLAVYIFYLLAEFL